MPLTLTNATAPDARRIADIHMAAFTQNRMLLAQFPTDSVRRGLHKCLIEKAIAEIRDPDWAVMVVKDEKSEIISFAKWSLPVHHDGLGDHCKREEEDEPWNWPEGTDMRVLDDWVGRVEAVSEDVLRGWPCYRLTFIATHPQHERRGAASLLVRWGRECSKEANIPIALESTMDAVPFYEKLGFRSEGRIAMELDGVGNDGKSVLYEEMCLVFKPYPWSGPVCYKN